MACYRIGIHFLHDPAEAEDLGYDVFTGLPAALAEKRGLHLPFSLANESRQRHTKSPRYGVSNIKTCIALAVLRERRVVQDRVFFRIDPIIGSTQGWLTDSFIGKRFKVEDCDDFFEGYPAAQQKCQEG